MRTINKNSGFTLVELLVSSSLFVILIALATGTFIQALRAQRFVTNFSVSMDNAALSIEQMAREIRLGFSFNASGEIDTLNFINSTGDTVNYRRIVYDGGKAAGVGRCIGSAAVCSQDSDYEPITSPDVNVSNLKFILMGAQSGDGLPPRITILLSVTGEKSVNINLQTTVSSRILDS